MLATLRLLRGAPRAGRAAVEAYQSARLEKLVAHAYRDVPFYRRLFDAHGLVPGQVRGIGDLHRIPVTSRRDLQRAEPRDLVAVGNDPSKLITSTTSGSTGEPVQIRRTWLEQNVLHLYRLRALEAVGVRKSDRLLLIAGVRPRDPRDSKLVGRALSALRLQRSRRDVHVLLDPEVIADEYRRYRPDVLSASPSILIRLAEVMPESERKELRPRLILSAGEVLAPDQRTRIEQELGAPVRNVYSSFEMGVLAWECPATGAMHTSDDSAIVEVLVDGRPAEPGETGEVVATNLHAFASPFLRYRQGDLATRGATPCACGESFATIGEVQGREVDLLPMPDGSVLHPYRLARALNVSGKGAFRQFQITQERLDRIVLRVVPAGEARPQKLEELRAAVQETLGSGVELVILVVENIPLEPGGKFRVARSLVGAEPLSAHATVASGRRETFA